ncbi:MAG TPA: SRPBCC domain-containing protein [Naasia sp.]|jgi:uncharacterized protein YndB with AHSA1/START domain
MTDSPPVTDRDVYITRAFAAPRAVVWRFFTDPALLATWFGPTGFSVPVDSVTVEPRVGGAWNLTMVGESGEQAPITGILTAVEPPEYLEVRLGAQTLEGELEDIVLRIRLHDHGDRTRVTLHQGPFPADEMRDMTADGWEQSFVKLDRELEAADR